MTGLEYQKLASRTMNKNWDDYHTIMHALHGMAGEVGEVHSLYQKIYQGHDFDLEHLKKELGDLMWFIAELCTAYDFSIDEIMQMNIDKLRARYPEGFESNRSLHRQEGDI